MWLAPRNLTLRGIAEAADLVPTTLTNLIRHPEGARPRTLHRLAAAMSAASGDDLTADHVLALATRAVSNPKRVSDEIEEALAQAAPVG